MKKPSFCNGLIWDGNDGGGDDNYIQLQPGTLEKFSLHYSFNAIILKFPDET